MVNFGSIPFIISFIIGHTRKRCELQARDHPEFLTFFAKEDNYMPDNIFQTLFVDGPDIDGDDPQDLADKEQDDAREELEDELDELVHGDLDQAI